MGITDELRKYVKTSCQNVVGNSRCSGMKKILAIADSIDAEHERVMREEYQRGANDGYDMGFASADDWLAQHEDAMAEHGWVKLPVDVDGVPIHVGDVLYGYGKTIEVVELRYGRSGWVLISRDCNGYADTFAFTHYHAPTVEDVLREFAANIADVLGGDDFKLDDNDELYAEFAKRLRLTEEVDA